MQTKTCLNIPNMIRALTVSLSAVFFLGSANGQETFYDFPYSLETPNDFVPNIPGSPNAIVSVQGTNGNYYGTTYWGGSNNLGTVFQMTPAGALTTTVSFNGTNGGQPSAGVVQGSDGNFYGTTYWGGSDNLGTVFQMTPGGALTTLASFNATNGGHPSAGVVQGSDGNFYGTTYFGGTANLGTVFQMTPGGALTTLVSFNAANGGHPWAGVVQGSDGNFYGTTYWGGNLSLSGGDGVGTVFQMTPGGALTTLVSFGITNGGHPSGGVVQGSDGNFYGTTYWGGNTSLNGGFGYGTVFKMTPAGALTTLASFNTTNGGHPYPGVVQGSDGNFYGTTYGITFLDTEWNGGNLYGTVFGMAPDGTLTTLVSFTGENGANPFAGLLQGSDGSFYGTTSTNGSSGTGTLFRFKTGVPDLTITQTSNGVIIAWPVTVSYTLQQNADLALTNGWAASSFSISTSNGTNSITITPQTGNLFFRLSNP